MVVFRAQLEYVVYQLVLGIAQHSLGITPYDGTSRRDLGSDRATPKGHDRASRPHL